ncbi:MAG TPA: single-stranded DNA-binding protein [Phycisphaerae bacterium]|nr:single-stranded DNA-binding protein [Phycisphaerae bacterium]
MSDQNAFHFSGRLTRDVQLSYTPSQTAVADVGVAIGRKYKDKDEVVFLDLRIWGAMAETWNKYFRKGSFVIASGRLAMDQWTGQDGAKRTKLRCIVENFTFPPLQSKPAPESPPAGGNYEDAPGEPQEPSWPPPGEVSGPPRGSQAADDEIPF